MDLNIRGEVLADGISPQMLRSTAAYYSIAPSLAKLFNSSLAEGVFPQDWKLARVVPVPKNDNLKNSVPGYRPIYLLPQLLVSCWCSMSKI